MTKTERLRSSYRPRAAFLPFHMRRQKKAVLVCHRRAGKTVALLEDKIDHALGCQIPNGRFQYIAPLYRQAKDIAWTYLKEMTAYLGEYRKINESELWVEVPSAAGTPARVRLYGADAPDTLRGIYSMGMSIDEFKDVNPQLITEVVLPALADHDGYLVLSGTPGGYDAFHEAYQKALRDPGWFAMLLKASESGILSNEILEGLAKEMPPPKYAQEMECDFAAAAEAQFIPSDLVQAASERREAPDTQMPVVIGVDVARFGDDRSVILTRQGRTLQDVKMYQKNDLVFLANEVMKWSDNVRPQMIYVDGAGVGGGVVDYLDTAGYPVRDVQVGSASGDPIRWANKRVELWGDMREWLATAQFRCADEHAEILKNDLLAPTYKYNIAGATALERKEDMKKRGIPSPDVADALALTFYERLAPPGLAVSRFAAQAHMDDNSNYDPLRY